MKHPDQSSHGLNTKIMLHEEEQQAQEALHYAYDCKKNNLSRSQAVSVAYNPYTCWKK
jgi:hypothetical protein